MSGSKEKSALTEAVYYILLSVYAPMHGYGIMQNVTMLSHGRVNLGPGTLYGAISTLLEKSWISPISSDGKAASRNKKEYIITDAGKLVIEDEIIRLKELLDNGINVTGGGL